MDKNCYSCKYAKPVELQSTECICKAGKGTKILNNYWVNTVNINNCDKYKELGKE